MLKYKIGVFLFGMTLCVISILVKPAFAQQITLSLSPPLIEATIKPSKSILIAYNLQNLADPTVVKIKVLPFRPKDRLGQVELLADFEGPIQFSLDNSIIKMDEPFLLRTKETQQLLLKIRVPEGAPNGDYYYALLAETQPPPTLDGVSGGAAKVTVGANILVTVTESGNIDIKGKIFSFDVLSRLTLGKVKIFDSNDKIPVVLTVENEGKNLIKPQGEIVLRGNFGETATYDIIPQNVLALSKRVMQATPSAMIDSDTGELKFAPTLILSGFFIGKYNLSADVNFGENSVKVMGDTSFIALPLKLILGIIVAVIVGIFIAKRLKE
jgi:hypothetical protein